MGLSFYKIIIRAIKESIKSYDSWLTRTLIREHFVRLWNAKERSFLNKFQERLSVLTGIFLGIFSFPLEKVLDRLVFVLEVLKKWQNRLIMILEKLSVPSILSVKRYSVAGQKAGHNFRYRPKTRSQQQMHVLCLAQHNTWFGISAQAKQSVSVSETMPPRRSKKFFRSPSDRNILFFQFPLWLCGAEPQGRLFWLGAAFFETPICTPSRKA